MDAPLTYWLCALDTSEPNPSPWNLLPTGDFVGPITRFWKVRCPIFIPRELLCTDRSRRPPIGGILHAMIHNPVLCAVRTLDETCVSHPIRALGWVLIEDGILVFAPMRWVHGVTVRSEFKEAKAVIAIVRAGGAVNEELLTSAGVGELLRPFIATQSIIVSSAVRRLLPRQTRHRYDLPLGEGACYSVWVLELRDA